LRNLQFKIFSVILYYKREIDAPTPDFTTFRNETLEYY
jgi:hypothetical protein